MSKLKLFYRNNVVVHIVVWALFITCNILIKKLFYPDYDYYGNIVEYFVLILVFYLNAHVVLEYNMKRSRALLLIPYTALLFGLYFGLLYGFQEYISPLLYGEPATLNLKYFLWGSIYNFLPILGFSYGYWYMMRTIRHQQQINRLLVEQQKEKEENLQLAKEKLHYEYSFLQAQINPHFLFNTLSFFYSRTLPFSKEVSGGIMKLSEMMRYALENHEDPEGKVPLIREINHLRNVIDINQLRFDNKLNIDFNLQGSLGNQRIIPLVLITLVENAFKHGDLDDPDHPLQISICIGQEEKKLHFKVRNKKREGPVEFSYGIGMQNVRNRLKLAYKDGFDLTTNNEEQFYTAELILNL